MSEFLSLFGDKPSNRMLGSGYKPIDNLKKSFPVSVSDFEEWCHRESYTSSFMPECIVYKDGKHVK